MAFSIKDLLPQEEPLAPMDDNAAVSDAAENPYLSIAVPQVQAAYDMMYSAVRYLVEGKNSSLKQIDKWIEKWQKQLDHIVEKYKELLSKFDDMAGSLELAMTLDVAKEAWDLIQEFPILRRYMGEANYWLLYDTVGLAATQGAAIAGDLATAVKEAIKAAIKGLLAMTDGLMSIETYLEMITQYWGALYTKFLWLPTLESVVPNVTCSYFYKPTVRSTSPNIANPHPGPDKFIPIPLPLPDPSYLISHPGMNLLPDYNDPQSWIDQATGEPKFLNIDALQQALEYWGSSYCNETIPGVTSADNGIPAIYRRRAYVRDGEEAAHPLKVGSTFAQLDTSKTVPAYAGRGNGNSTDALAQFYTLWEDSTFQMLLQNWAATWETAHRELVALIRSAVGSAPLLDADGNVKADALGNTVYGELTSMRQVTPGAGDAREDAYNKLVGAVVAGFAPDGSPTISTAAYQYVNPIVQATKDLVERYRVLMKLEKPPVTSAAQAGIVLCKGMTQLLAKAALALRREAPMASQLYSLEDSVPVFNGESLVRALALDDIPQGEQWAEGITQRDMRSPGYVAGNSDIWGTTPTYGELTPDVTWDQYVVSLVYPKMTHNVPIGFLQRDADREVLEWLDSPDGEQVAVGTVEEGALSDPIAWDIGPIYEQGAKFPTSALLLEDDIDTVPMTVIGALVQMMRDQANHDTSLEEEVADEVGYSILKGRRPLAACFDPYGRLYGMYGWCFECMATGGLSAASPLAGLVPAPAVSFNGTYERIPGSDLWYSKKDPRDVVYRHSSFYSSTLGMPCTIFHRAMVKRTYRRGSESYTFMVFPTESISVQEIHEGTVGAMRSVDAVSPSGEQYHYIVVANSVPKCPKYVDSKKWSIADILHELYLLAWGMSPFCGDNGDRFAKLSDALSEFGISPPEFFGQLPENNDEYAKNFEIGIFNKYADKIEQLVDSVYQLREQILAATESW